MAIISNELIDIIELKDCININNFLSNIPYKCTNLLCMHINIRSLIKNFAALEQCIYSCDRCIDIIILTEANIKDNVSSLFNIKGYGMHTELRKKRYYNLLQQKTQNYHHKYYYQTIRMHVIRNHNVKYVLPNYMCNIPSP